MKNPFSSFLLLNPTPEGTSSRNLFSPEHRQVHQGRCTLVHTARVCFWCSHILYMYIFRCKCFSLGKRAVLSHGPAHGFSPWDLPCTADSHVWMDLIFNSYEQRYSNRPLRSELHPRVSLLAQPGAASTVVCIWQI